jgi:hypothetical protein
VKEKEEEKILEKKMVSKYKKITLIRIKWLIFCA